MILPIDLQGWAHAVLPLNGRIRGGLIVLADECGAFDHAEIQLLGEFAGGLSLAQVAQRATERLA